MIGVLRSEVSSPGGGEYEELWCPFMRCIKYDSCISEDHIFSAGFIPKSSDPRRR